MQVATGREHKTIELLERVIGCETRAQLFAPRYRFHRKVRGTWELTEELLTPGYAYITASMLDIEDIARKIRMAPAFGRVLSQDGRIIPLSADEERWIGALTGASHVVEPSYGYVEGDRVTITDGPLKGIESTIKKIDRHKRLAYVEVRLLGRTKVVKVGAEVVRKA